MVTEGEQPVTARSRGRSPDAAGEEPFVAERSFDHHAMPDRPVDERAMGEAHCIDTRFFPQPERTRVALYPSWLVPPVWSRSGASEADVAALVAQHYEVAPAQVLLTSSGAAALALLCGWLQEREQGPLRVAMPAYCCPSVCEAILAAGATPVFVDVGVGLGLQESSIDFAARMGCRALVWPQLFGARELDAGALRLCAQRGLWFISDEAQSFPGPVYPAPSTSAAGGAPLARIFTFGPAKLLAGLGGGGACLPDAERAADLAAYVARVASAPSGRVEAGAVVGHVRDALLQSFITRSRRCRRVAERLRLARPLRPDLRELLEATGVRPVGVARMDPLARAAAAWLLRNRQALVARVSERACEIAAEVSASAGPAALALLAGLRGAPSVCALSVAPRRRHALGAALSAQGIQTTWFYYPLNRLSHFAGLPSERTPNTDGLAARVLILPLRWHHAPRNVAALRLALRRVLAAETSHPGAAS